MSSPSNMNQPKRRLPRKTKGPSSELKKEKSKKNTIITVAAISAVIIVIVIVGVYLINVMPYQRTIIKVENDSVNIGYFIRRVLNNPNGDDIWGTLETVTQELIIAQEAPRIGIVVTDQDIEKALREAAQGDAESITDAEYKEWYRQRLNTSQLSDKEFREIVRRSLLGQQLGKLLAASVPTSGEQGRLHVILVASYDEAVKVKERADGGEDFTVLAKELSIDSTTKDKGGEIGWLPFGVLDSRYASTVAALEIGQCSDPVMNDEQAQNYVLFMVSEKSASMEYSADHLQTLQSKALPDWLTEQMNIKKIEFHGLGGGGFDSETNAWIAYQVQRLRKGISGTTTTTEEAKQQ